MNMEKISNGLRNDYMDFLKGILILTVIIGHCISDLHRYDLLFNFIYSFHMPVLFFISAYIEEKNRYKYVGQMREMPLRRLKSLLLPYFCWSMVYIWFYGGFSEGNIEKIIRTLLGYEQSGLWFLPVLFGLKFFHYLYWKLQKQLGKHSLIKDIMICLLCEIIIIVLAFWVSHPYMVNLISYAIPYFFAVIIIDNEVVQEILKSKFIIIGVAIIYLLVFPFFSFYDTRWTTQIIRIFLAMCISIICFAGENKWKYISINKVICCWGRYSLAIYVMHVFFIGYKRYLEQMEPIALALFLVVFMAVAVATICVAIARIIEKNSWLSVLLLGTRTE